MQKLESKVRKRTIVIGFVLIFFTLFISPMMAADELIKWKKLDTMDTNFSIIRNKASDKDILLTLDVEDAGTYHLYYYLEDGRQTDIQLTQSYDQMKVQYHVREDMGATNVTQNLVSLSYLEMDYSLTVPDWKYDAGKLVGPSGGLEYSIPRSASSKYPGVAFNVNNKKVLIKWDFQEDKVYILVDDYEAGKVMPVIFVTPTNGTKSIKVLKQLEDFVITPTHLKPNVAGTDDVELAPVILPNGVGDVPGNRPGLKVQFKQPKELDMATWQYVYTTSDFDDVTAIFEIENIGTEDYLDFMIHLKNDPDQSILSLPASDEAANAGVMYSYDPVTFTYTIQIVKNKSDLIHQDTTVQWSKLAMSSIYNVNVGFQVASGSSSFDAYEFTTYQPKNKFAYTYMGYKLKRANVEEAYLDIEPFNVGGGAEVEYIVLYSKVIKPDLDPDEDLWLRNYHSGSGTGDEIFIPVPFKSQSSQDAYQVLVNFAGTQIHSQVLNYEAINDLNVPPTTPSIRLIDHLFVVPPMDGASTNPHKVQFDMVWDAPTNKEVKELDLIFENTNGLADDFLYYEVSVNDVPTNEASNPFQVVKVFEVYKEGGVYKLRPYAGLTGAATPSEQVNYNVGYNKTDERLRMEKITLYDEGLYAGGWTNNLTTVIDEVADTYTVTDTNIAHDFEFPGVNYMRIQAITMKDGQVSTSQLSVPRSLSLSMIRYDIPIVDTLDYDPLYGLAANNTTGVTLKWHTIQSANYENKMLEPIGKEIEEIVYSVYIAEDPAKIRPLDADDANYTAMVMDTDQLMQLDATEIQRLREGGVVYFNRTTDEAINTDLEIHVRGLDPNKDYAVRIVTKLQVKDMPDVGNPVETRRSDPSSVLSVTVPKVPGEPGDEEVHPLAPELFKVAFSDESLINAGLTWFMPEEMTFADDLHGFEIFALEDRSLPDNLSGKGIGITELLENARFADNVVEGWRLYKHEGVTYFKKYNRLTHLWEAKNLNLVTRENNKFYVIDDANAPNKVNYYYVRTIKLKDELVKSASPWTVDTLTTAPVKGPINLKVDYGTSYTYAPKEEIILRFDAPIPDVLDIGTDYRIEIHVKGEDDITYSTSKYSAVLLGEGINGPAGYKRLFYRLADLAPGKTYSIKVRIEDRTKPEEVLPDGTRSYPKSPYSDRVLSRTEFDQAAHDKEQKYKKYIEYYVEKAEELKEALYFKVTNTTTETGVKYRENYTEGMIQRKVNHTLALYSDNKAINTFYIPSRIIESMNDHRVTLTIESKGQLVGLRPKTVGISITKEIDEIIEAIKQYNNTNEDYYLRIRVYTDTYHGRIHNSPPSSPLVQVELSVVGSKEEEEKIDERMVGQLNAVIEAKKVTLISRIEEELTHGINDAKLLRITQDVVDQVAADYVAQAAILFKATIGTDITIITEIDQPMYVTLKADSAFSSNRVYTKENGLWQQVSSGYRQDRYHVDTKAFAPLILGPSLVMDGSLKELYSQKGSDVINTYDLTDIFSVYELKEPESVINKYQWIGALSRLIGAKKGLDTADYLRARGIETSSVNSYQPVAYEASLDLFIRTYAYRHQINLNRVRISNYYPIEDMNQVEAQYQQTLLQGANLGIIPLKNGFVAPKHKMTLVEAIRLLITLHEGLNVNFLDN